MTNDNELVDAKAVADHFGVTVPTVYTWARRGVIPCIRPTRTVTRFRIAEIEAVLRSEARRIKRGQVNRMAGGGNGP